MQENTYEMFRNVLTMSLCDLLSPEDVEKVLSTIDIAMSDFEICKKNTDLITVGAIPEIVKIYLASRSVANLSKGTLQSYKYQLFNFFMNMPKSYQDITANDIRLFLWRLKAEKNVSDCYLENIREILHTFFRWCVDNEYLIKNPCAKVDKIKYTRNRRQPLTSFELETVRWQTVNVREKALIDFLFSTGCRVSECASVRLSDINWDNRAVLIRHGKGDKQRIVYFNSESELTLKEYLSTRDDATDSLFVTLKSPHAPLKKGGIETIFRQVSKRTNIHVYPHKMRHTFASVGIQSGVPLEKLQALLGHADPKTTMIYAKQNQDDIRLEHSKVYM